MSTSSTNTTDDEVNIEIDSSTESSSTNNIQNKRKTIIPFVCGCSDSKYWKIIKYIYVIGVIILGFLIVILTQISDSIHDWFDSQQRIILQFLKEDSVIYIILVLLLITLLKSIGVKDVLGLRTISVVILAYRMIDNNRILTLLLCMFIIGILSSISKLIEYKVIGNELQMVQGTPVKYIFKYARKILSVCIKDETKLQWLDPKYTFDISEKSRDNKHMNVLQNIRNVFNTNDTENDGTNIVNIKHTFEWTFSNVICTIFYFIIAVIWTSVIEWVQPITELFLFAHNWSLTFTNILIVILSEIADFDKAVEAMFIINGLYSDGNIIGAKVKAVASKGIFWALGYCIVAPLTLIWAYQYHKKYLAPSHQSKPQMEIQINNTNKHTIDTNSQKNTNDMLL